MLGAEDKVTISSEFDDLRIRYTTDGNDPMWFSDEYTKPFALTKSKETVKAALFLGRRQMSAVFTADYVNEVALGTAESPNRIIALLQITEHPATAQTLQRH